MSAPPRPLAGRHRWLTNLRTGALALGLLLAASWAAVTVTFPEGTGWAFLGVLVGVAVVFNALGDGLEQRRLLTLRGLGEGAVPLAPASLLRAAREVAQMPLTAFWLTLGFLAIGPFVVGAVWALVSPVPVGVVLQVASVGFIVAPLTATLALLVSTPRARTVQGELVALGLPVATLTRELPAPFVLRRRLMFFAAVAVATPLLLVGDLALSRLRALAELLARAPDAAAMQALADAQGGAGLLPLAGPVLLAVFVVALTAWLAGTMLGDPLKALAVETERLARGQHGQPRLIAAEYETFAAAGALVGMEAQLVDLLGRLGLAASDLSGATGVLSGARPAPHAAGKELDTASTTTVELARSAKEIADNAQRVSAFARKTLTSAQAGRDGADGFMAAMVQVREGNQAIADSVVRLNKRVQQVGRIIEFINGIADKSDLLALNAELEGHKAGEVGRGFSLVAAEMRRLAESVMQSTREIGSLIDEIRDATHAAVMATEAGVKATDAGGALALKVGDGLSRIVDFANQSANAMHRISLATAQQQAGTDQLVGAMGEIVRSREAREAAAQEMAQAHAQLIALVRDLDETVARFEVQR